MLDALKPFGISLPDLKIEIQMSSSECIKQYVLHSQAMAFSPDMRLPGAGKQQMPDYQYR